MSLLSPTEQIHRGCGGHVVYGPLGLYSCKKCYAMMSWERVEIRLIPLA